MSNKLMEASHVTKYYPVKSQGFSFKPERLKAVSDVSFNIYRGETLGLVGESGSGKSTLGRMLVGLEKPDSGYIRYEGKELAEFGKKEKMEKRTELQMIFQDSSASLNPRKHIFDILAAPMLYHGIATKYNVEEKVSELLRLVGLPESTKDRYAHEFSGGQRQRIGIAKALSLSPKLIVCDEPVSALDVSIQAQILNLLIDLRKELDLTYLFIAHGLASVNYVSTRIAVMYLGRIVEIAGAEELFKHPLHPYTKALVKSSPVPDPDKRDRKRVILQGEPPSNIRQPEGCPFHPRCPKAVSRCRKNCPQLETVNFHDGKEHRHELACPVAAGEISEEKGGETNE